MNSSPSRNPRVRGEHYYFDDRLLIVYRFIP
jgi:hypothetical protein